MNYNNEYGMKPIPEKKHALCLKNTPVISVEDLELQNTDDEIAQSCVSSCESNNYYPPQCSSQNTQPILECTDTCAPNNNCCSQSDCTYNPREATCFCTYMNIIYSEGKLFGPTTFDSITITNSEFSIIPNYSQPSGCCTSCAIDSTSMFTIDSIRTTITNFILDQPTIPNNQIIINGINALTVTQSANVYSALIDPSALNSLCVCNDLGTKGNVLMMGLSPWRYKAKYEICGNVTTQGSSCKFRIVATNLATLPSLATNSINLAGNDICLPNNSDTPIVMDVSFNATGNLVNPVINVTGGPSPLPTTLSITGNLMLNTSADIRILKNTRVCMNGMLK